VYKAGPIIQKAFCSSHSF